MASSGNNNKVFNFIPHVPKWMWTVVKSVVSLGLVAWLVFSFQWNEVWGVMAQIPWWIIAGYLFIMFTSFCTMGLRLKILLSAQQINLSLFYSIQLVLIGAFCGNFMPSSMGGDVFKFIYLARAGYSKSVSGIAIVFDRMLNMLAVCLFLPFALTLPGSFDIDFLRVPDIKPWFDEIIIIGSVLFIIIFVLFILRKKILTSIPWMETLKNRFVGILLRIKNIFQQWVTHINVVIKASLLSLIVIFLIFFGGWFLARGIGIDISIITWFSIQACLSVFAFLPISLNGLGVQEVSLVYLMSVLGVPPGKSLALALLLRVLLVSVSLPGAYGVFSAKAKPSMKNQFSAENMVVSNDTNDLS